VSHIDLLDDSVWEGVSAEAQIDFLRCGEEMVKSTLSLADGADFRALTTMGMFGAVGVAIFAAVATIISGSHPSWSMTIGGLSRLSAYCLRPGFAPPLRGREIFL
jgi:hypothetical protein